MANHCLQQRQRAADVHAIVGAGIRHRLADISESSEVNHHIRSVRCEHRVKTIAIEDVSHSERSPTDGIPVPGQEVIVDDWLMAPPRQCLARMAADITGAPRNKYFHGTPPWHPSNRLPLSYRSFKFILSFLFFSGNSYLNEQSIKNCPR